MVQDELTRFREVLRIEGGRNLYNYSFSNGPEPYDELIRVIESSEQEQVLEFLHKHPDLPLSKDNRAYSPLHFAAKEGMSEVVRELERRGAEVNKRDANHQSTPLGWACFYGRPEAVRALLDAGAEVDENCRENVTRGINGELTETSGATPDDYRRVQELLARG